MGDLISRKALLDKFQNKADKSTGETRKILLEVCQSIFREKTAYNLDMVVDRLEKIATGYKTQYDMGCYSTEDDVRNAINSAINIVKHGETN